MSDDSLLDSYNGHELGADVATNIVLASLSAVPGLSVLADAVERGLTIAGQQRFEAHYRRVVEIVQVLAKTHGLPVSEIVGDGLFYNAMLTTGIAYQRSGDSEKLEILAAALSHTGSWADDDDLVQRRVLDLVERLQPQHLLAIRLQIDPARTTTDADPPIGRNDTLGDALEKMLHLELDVSDILVSKILEDVSGMGMLVFSIGRGDLFNDGFQDLPGLTGWGQKVWDYLTPIPGLRSSSGAHL
jgi:hypothetical protein